MAGPRAYPNHHEPKTPAGKLAQVVRPWSASFGRILEHVHALQERNTDLHLRAGLAAIERTAQEGTAMARLILEGPATRTEEPLATHARKPGSPARILVVGDQEALGKGLVETLAQQGHAAEVLNHPLQALVALRQEEVDMVFTDLGTPDLTGWELASRARVIRPGLPVILVTRYADQLDQDRLQAMGVTRVLSRPYLEEEIAGLVANTFRPLPAAA